MADHFRLDTLFFCSFVFIGGCQSARASVSARFGQLAGPTGNFGPYPRFPPPTANTHIPRTHMPSTLIPSTRAGRASFASPPFAGIASATSSLQNLSTQHQKIKRAHVRFRPLGPKTGCPLSGRTNPDTARLDPPGTVEQRYQPLIYGFGATPGNLPREAQLGFRHRTDILRRNDHLIKPNAIHLLFGPTVSDIAFQCESVRLQLLNLPPGDSGPMPD